MTQVDFYILKDSKPQAGALFACRFTEKAYKKGHQVYINVASDQQLRQLDDLLWTFRDGSFLPHALYNESDTQESGITPILLGHDIEPEESSDVLVNLSGDVPSFFSRFSRVAELVAGDDAQRAAARVRYTFYRDRGYTLNTHEL